MWVFIYAEKKTYVSIRGPGHKLCFRGNLADIIKS